MDLSNSKMIITIKQAGDLDDLQLMEQLLQNWSLNTPEIEGILTLKGDFLRLMSVTDFGGKSLEYPLKDLQFSEKLSKRGVFIHKTKHKHYRDGQLVRAKFELANKKEREKHRNPFLIQLDPYTIKTITNIPKERIYKQSDGSISLEDTLCRSYIDNKRHDLISEIREIELKVEDLAFQTESAKEKKKQIVKEISEKNQEAKAIENQISSLKEERDKLLKEVEEEVQSARTELAADLKRRKKDLEIEFNREVEHYQEIKEQYRQDNAQLLKQLETMRSKYNLEDQKLRSQTDELREYVRTKADRLLQLEFISREQYDALMPFNRSEHNDIKEWPIIEDSLGARSEAISHIQRYLYRKDIVYPRALLENFFTLLCTGDMIILSGLSGSGKTNLVKSFATATGNVPHIISVKPNWTSAEDLTGYYNPLQQKYLTTPFLDALFEAKKDPDHLHIICLDEMNLARVEYYFADFLSALEERTEKPQIPLYSDEEAGNIFCEFRLFLETLLDISGGENEMGVKELLSSPQIAEQIRQKLGVEDGESMLQLHSRLRRMVSGVLSVDSTLKIPDNVRFVGAVNIDDTTHFLSPKVLDRSHVLQFANPLTYWSQVDDEVRGAELPTTGIRIPADFFPKRGKYPSFSLKSKDPIITLIWKWSEQYFAPIGIEIGVRTILQCIHYRDQLKEIVSSDGVDDIALNNLFRQKILPRFSSVDGNQRPRNREESSVTEIIDLLNTEVDEKLLDYDVFCAKEELRDLIARGKNNQYIFNYWS